MQQKVAAAFVKEGKRYRGRDYLGYTITYHLTPVLETYRPAVMLSLVNDQRRLFTLWEEYKHSFFPTGKMFFYELRKKDKSVSVLFYHYSLLNRIIDKENHRSFLQKFGYEKQVGLLEKLGHLQQRFLLGECPHEVGLFLGIPLEDVRGFILNKGKDYQAHGSWKVYTNLERAQNQFARCENAKKNFLKFISLGYPPCDYLRIHASQGTDHGFN